MHLPVWVVEQVELYRHYHLLVACHLKVYLSNEAQNMRENMDITILKEVILVSGLSRSVYPLFAPYQFRWVCTCSWAVHEAIWLQLQNRGGGEGGGRERKGICAVIVSPPMEIESDSSANKYFTIYDLLLPRLGILHPKPVGRATCFLDKKRLLSLNWFERSCLIWCRVYFLKVYATICRRYLIIASIQRRPARLYPSRFGLGWKPFIFDNYCV